MASCLKSSNRLNISRNEAGFDSPKKSEGRKGSVSEMKGSVSDDVKETCKDIEAEDVTLNLEKLNLSESSPPFGDEDNDTSGMSSLDELYEDECPKNWRDIYAFYEEENVDEDSFPLSFTFSGIRNCYEANSRNIFYFKSYLNQLLANKEEFGESFVIEDLDKPTLPELLELLENSPEYKKTLPTPRMDFHSGPLANPDITDFVGKYASQIKYLSLCYNCSCSHYAITVTIPEYLSFLQKLTAAEEVELNFPSQWKDIESEELSEKEMEELKSFDLNLPALKTVTVGDNVQLTKVNEAVFLKILSAAENLEEVDNMFPALAEVMSKNGKMHLIKSMDISPSEDEESNSYHASYGEFAESGPKLRTMNIGYDALRYQAKENEKAIGKILLSSKDTLEELWIHPLARMKRLKMPVLSKLKKLHLSSLPTDKDRDFLCAYAVQDAYHGLESLHLLRLRVRGWVEKDYVMFPRGINVATAFPNLHYVALDLRTNDTQYARLYFPSRPCIPSVKELSIRGICTSTWIKKLALMFPNLTKLDLGFDASDGEAARDLWLGWPLLESLYFRFVEWDDLTYPALDSIFTGIPEKCCEKLRKIKGAPAPGRAAGVEKLRKKASILSLKNLKQFKMRLMDQDKCDESFDCCSAEHSHLPALDCKDQDYKLISPVSLYYAFMKMAELKVTVEYSKELSSGLSRDLNSLWPHVKFEESD